MKKEFLLLGLALCCAGCTTVEKDAFIATTNVETQPIMFEPLTEVIGKKVVGRATDSSTFWGLITTESPSEFVDTKEGISSSYSEIESAALANACEKSGADIILDPKVTTEEFVGFLGFNRETTVKVDGVPAKIVGARELSLEETTALINARKKEQAALDITHNGDNALNINNFLTIKFGQLTYDANGYGYYYEEGDYDFFKMQLSLRLFEDFSLVGSFQKLEGDTSYSLKANIYNLDLRYNLLDFSNCSLSTFLGVSYIDYEYTYSYSYTDWYATYYTGYYYNWEWEDYEVRVWDPYYREWDWETRYRRVRKRYSYLGHNIHYYTAWRSYQESDKSLSPMAGLQFEYNSQWIYFGASFIYIKAYDSDSQNFYLAYDTMSLELDLGLNLTSFLRLDVAYFKDFGKEGSFSGVCGGATLLF